MKKLFKLILSIIQFIFILFLFLVLFIKIYNLISEKLYENAYTAFGPYSYLKVNSRYLFDEFELDEYLLINKTEDYNVDDYIAVLDEGNVELYKIDSVNQSSIICKDRNGEVYSISDKNVQGEVIYHNNDVSKVINILINPIVILIMFLYCIFIGQYTYERYSSRGGGVN